MTLRRRRDIISDKRSRREHQLADQTRCGDYKLIIITTIDVGGPFHFLAHMGAIAIPNKTQSKNSTRKLTAFNWIHHLDHPHYSIFADTLDLGGIIICRYNGTEDGGVDNNNSIIS